MKNILIIEDDNALSNGIKLALAGENYIFYQVYNLKEASKKMEEIHFDLLLLDVNLPDGNGLDFLKDLRIHSQIPVIVLTANDMETDVVTGLYLGADDYITKPFSLMVLRARVYARLRMLDQESSNIIIFDEFKFDFDKMLFYKRNLQIELSKTEQKLLKIFMNNKGITLKRSDLVDRIWTDGAEYVDENALSVTIKRLRDKLEDDASKPDYIKTVYGIGYVWAVK